MTFSIVARCAETRGFGIAVSSSSPAVAARCAHARAGVGAVASQNITDPALGSRMLGLMAGNFTAEEALSAICRSSPHIEYRQLIAIDRYGGTAIHSGDKTLGTWAEAQGKDVACAGNLLANESVPEAMMAAFAGSTATFGERLIDAMIAGRDAGGEAGPVHSAGLLLVRDVSWPVADLRVDWTEGCPIDELYGLWTLYEPQLKDYVARAVDPRSAPSYGVAGNE
jgi:uncharacterized Ntn-hydrolase superfamily protein